MSLYNLLCDDISDAKASPWQAHRTVLLEVFFRRLAAPTPSAHDAMLLTSILNADPSFLLWQNLPFQLEELLTEYLISLEEYTMHRMAVFRGMLTRLLALASLSVLIALAPGLQLSSPIARRSLKRASLYMKESSEAVPRSVENSNWTTLWSTNC